MLCNSNLITEMYVFLLVSAIFLRGSTDNEIRHYEDSVPTHGVIILLCRSLRPAMIVHSIQELCEMRGLTDLTEFFAFHKFITPGIWVFAFGPWI